MRASSTSNLETSTIHLSNAEVDRLANKAILGKISIESSEGQASRDVILLMRSDNVEASLLTTVPADAPVGEIMQIGVVMSGAVYSRLKNTGYAEYWTEDIRKKVEFYKDPDKTVSNN